LLLEIGALSTIGLAVYAKLKDLENVAPDKPREQVRVIVELELRQILCVLFEFVVRNSNEESA
jgi:hypothetical protein